MILTTRSGRVNDVEIKQPFSIPCRLLDQVNEDAKGLDFRIHRPKEQRTKGGNRLVINFAD